mgnify:CR=1 FL=1
MSKCKNFSAHQKLHVDFKTHLTFDYSAIFARVIASQTWENNFWDTLYLMNKSENKVLGAALYTGCPKKNSDPRLNGHKGHQNWTNDKSRVSFEKFRKFPV